MKYDETTRAMMDDADKLHATQRKVARALARLPDNRTRRKVLRAVCVLLDRPDLCGDRPNV